MDRLVQKLLLLFIFLAPKIEKVFGLSSLRYKNQRIKILTLSSRAIVISFIVLYPVSCVKVLDFFRPNVSSVTFYARNLTFAFNWLLLVFVLVSRMFTDDNQAGFTEIELMFRKLIKLQNFHDNLILLMRCTLKDALVFGGMFFVNYGKYKLHTNKNLSAWEKSLQPLLFLPFIILSLASNRIYVANVVVKHFLMRNLSDLESTAANKTLQIKLGAINYSRVHSAFVDSSKHGAINLLAILSFCTLNIVYEVKEIMARFTRCMRCLTLLIWTSWLLLCCAQFLLPLLLPSYTLVGTASFHFQAYFFLLYIVESIESNRPIRPIVAIVVITFITCCALELIFTIRIYDDVKKVADTISILNRFEFSSQLHDFHVKLFMIRNVMKV